MPVVSCSWTPFCLKALACPTVYSVIFLRERVGSYVARVLRKCLAMGVSVHHLRDICGEAALVLELPQGWVDYVHYCILVTCMDRLEKWIAKPNSVLVLCIFRRAQSPSPRTGLRNAGNKNMLNITARCVARNESRHFAIHRDVRTPNQNPTLLLMRDLSVSSMGKRS